MICPNLRIELDSLDLEPTRAHYGDAGLDCRASHDVIIYPNCTEVVDLGFKVEIPYTTAGFLVSRSGQSKVRVSLANRLGIIDHQYRGKVMARIENLGQDEFIIKRLDRVAQLIIVPILLPLVEIVASVSDTTRGAGGFGSTGK